jgi:hypothetical protein
VLRLLPERLHHLSATSSGEGSKLSGAPRTRRDAEHGGEDRRSRGAPILISQEWESLQVQGEAAIQKWIDD